MTDRLPDEIHYPGPASEFIKALAYESFGILLKERIAEFNDDAATKVLSKLDEFVELIKKADQCYNEILSLIVDDELRIIDQMGYSYKKTPDGTIKFSSATDVSNSSEESDKALLTEADYYKVLNQLSEEFHSKGIPEKYKPAYSRVKGTYQEMMNLEGDFNTAIIQAKPYLHDVEGIMLITQYYSNMQLLQSLFSMFGAF